MISSATARASARALLAIDEASQRANAALTIRAQRDVAGWHAAARGYRLAALLVSGCAVPMSVVPARRRFAAALTAAAEVCDELAVVDSPAARKVLSVAITLIQEGMREYSAALAREIGQLPPGDVV